MLVLSKIGSTIKKRTILIVLFAISMIMFSLLVPLSVSAQVKTVTCKDPYPFAYKSQSGEVVCCPKSVSGTKGSDLPKKCFFDKYVNPAIYLLSIVAGVVAIGGIIWGGIQYSMSAGDAQKVTKAKGSIVKALTALVVLILFVPAVKFVTPGGLIPNSPDGPPSAKNCSSANTMMGIKPWYAYLPDDSFDQSCELKNNVSILPAPAEKDSKGNITKQGNPGVLPNVVLAVVDGMLRIAGVIAVVFVIVGGVQYMTSQGEPSKTKQALSTIINALIGLAIALVAAVVVAFLGTTLVK